MKIVVFLGPSMPLEQAKAFLPDAIYLPPAKQGDLLSVATIEKPNVIILIDGCFSQNLSVWHKEILYALSQGIHVFGAASMGAIRAAECESFGMVGIGNVFRWYKSGALTDDDEVAVTHSEDGQKCLSFPMVNVRATLMAMLAEGYITPDEVNQIGDSVKARFYPDRTISAIPKRHREAFKECYEDVKGGDARIALKLIAQKSEALSSPFEPKFKMEKSMLFDAQFERDRLVRRDDANIPLAAIDSFAALHAPRFELDNWNAANRVAAVTLAEILGLTPTPEEVQEEFTRFFNARGINGDDGVKEWMRSNDLNAIEVAELCNDNAAARKAHAAIRASRAMRRNTKILLDHLRITGDYPEIADEAAAHEMIVDRLAPDVLQRPITPGAAWPILVEHAKKCEAPFVSNFSEWLKESGFQNQEELKIDLERSKIARGE